VVKQGFRSDLELVIPSYKGDQGEFRKTMESQRKAGGFLPEKQVVTTSSQNLREAFQREQVSQVSEHASPAFDVRRLDVRRCRRFDAIQRFSGTTSSKYLHVEP
jgi:hypothetical protein